MQRGEATTGAGRRRERRVVRASRLIAVLVAVVVTWGLPGRASGATAQLGAPALGAHTDGSYAVVDAAGGVITYGRAAFAGDLLTTSLNAPVTGAAAGRDGGYWLCAGDGGVFAFGRAGFLGSMGGRALNRPIVGMAATPDGGGYWLVASDGGVFAFGDAGFFGSTGAMALNQPVVGMAATPDGGGYWLVASDGGVFAYGDAGFFGSTGVMTLDQPVVGMAATSDGGGYWLVASDGGVFSFGDAAFHGSLGGDPPGSPIAAVTTSPDGGGYWMVGRDDSIYAFGDAVYTGGAASPMHPPFYPQSVTAIPPAVALLALPTGPQAAHGGGVRVAFVGDSLAGFEAFYTALGSPGFVLDNGAIPGCGISGAAPVERWSAPGVAEAVVGACDAWAAQLQWVTQRFHPDAVVLQVGYWEEQNRLFDGSFTNLGDPSFASAVQDDVQQALDILHNDGAAVLLETSPYFGDGTPPWATDDYNALVGRVAAANPSFVTIFDVNRLLCPGGAYTPVVQGVLARTPDNIHLTVAGVQALIDPSLDPLAVARAMPTYAGSS